MRLFEMEILVRVAEAGSMSAAARQLHLTPAAVSATVGRVEEELGIRLF
ncbi:MAG: LysR family transcriptional regulator, partial [Myxococcota bacterium]